MAGRTDHIGGMVATRFAVAVHILLFLACQRREGPATSHLIARSVNTNPVVVRRITGQLARAGLLQVRRGPGGAALTRDAAAITLGDVWVAVNAARPGPVLTLHDAPNLDCPVGRQMHGVLGEVFGRVDQAMLAELHRTTLAMLMRTIQPVAA